MNQNKGYRFWNLFKLILDKIANFGDTKTVQTCAIIFFALILGIVVGTGKSWAEESMKLNINDSGKVVEVLVGDELNVTLPSNPTTGYAWELILLNSAVLKPDKTEYFAFNTAMGSGGVEVIKFHAFAPGKSAVKLI